MKGFARTMESVFAIMIIMSFLFNMRAVRLTSESDAGYAFTSKLKEMDDSGMLRVYVENHDVESMRNAVDIRGFNYTIVICNVTMCYGSVPEAANVHAYYYFVSGHKRYEPYEVRLYVF